MAELRRESRLDQPRDPRLRLPRFDPEAFGRWSEAIARSLGTARFIVYMTMFIVAWFGWNTLAPSNVRFDPYTFTFLTLILSLQASYAAPLILLAQNRQADRDRLVIEEDRRRAAMQKADTEFLARELAALRIALGEVATRDFLRSELNRLSEELDDAAHRRARSDRKQQKRHDDPDPGGDRLDEPAPGPEVLATFELDRLDQPRRVRRPPSKGERKTGERTGGEPRATDGRAGESRGDSRGDSRTGKAPRASRG